MRPRVELIGEFLSDGTLIRLTAEELKDAWGYTGVEDCEQFIASFACDPEDLDETRRLREVFYRIVDMNGETVPVTEGPVGIVFAYRLWTCPTEHDEYQGRCRDCRKDLSHAIPGGNVTPPSGGRTFVKRHFSASAFRLVPLDETGKECFYGHIRVQGVLGVVYNEPRIDFATCKFTTRAEVEQFIEMLTVAKESLPE